MFMSCLVKVFKLVLSYDSYFRKSLLSHSKNIFEVRKWVEELKKMIPTIIRY